MSRALFSVWKGVLLGVLALSLAAASLDAAQQQDSTPRIGAPDAPVAGRGRGRGPVTPLPPATEPRPRDDRFHQSFLEVARGGNIDLLFVGDSITDWWDQEARGLPVWNEAFAPLKAATFGIAGDTTQGVLWRMQNGELDGFKAKLIVLMIGTNNINRNTNDDIAEGNRAIIEEFKKRQPQAKVLLLGVFPRGAQPDSPFRASIKAINDKLATLADSSKVFYLDIGDKFLAADGSIPPEVMPDALHPSAKGYQIWADAIKDTVTKLMK